MCETQAVEIGGVPSAFIVEDELGICTVQRNVLLLTTAATPGISSYGQAFWGASMYFNAIEAAIKGTPGFGLLDRQAEAFGQKLSSECHID